MVEMTRLPKIQKQMHDPKFKADMLAALKSAFTDGDIRIWVNINPSHAPGGSGQWNEITLSVVIDDEEVYKFVGDVSLCDPI